MPNRPRLTIRLSDEDLDELRALAKRARLTVSELIRQWIRVGELPVRESLRPAPESLVNQLEAPEGAVDWNNRPTYNHTRGDSPLTPCPECRAPASPERER